MSHKLVIAILLLNMTSAIGQTNLDLEKKYGKPVMSYVVSDHIVMTPEYTAEGQVCMMRLYPRHYSNNINYVSANLPFPELMRVLNELVPHAHEAQRRSHLTRVQRAEESSGLRMPMETWNSPDAGTTAGEALKRVKAGYPETLIGDGDLAQLVLQNSFFIDPGSRRYTSARLLGLNGTKDKALVEVYVNRGPLAEEWYHVVISKSGRAWKFFSIIQIAVS